MAQKSQYLRLKLRIWVKPLYRPLGSRCEMPFFLGTCGLCHGAASAWGHLAKSMGGGFATRHVRMLDVIVVIRDHSTSGGT